jgi:uncharacterized protein
MTPEEIEYIRYRLARAREAIDEAVLLLENRHLNAAVNRLYYACFYAVSGLLLTEGLSSAKHSGVKSLFDRYWIKPGRLPIDLGRFYRRLFDQRQQGDYADFVAFDGQEVSSWLDETRAFVARVSELVQQTIADANAP